MFDYEANYVKNYDGDTITFSIDLGFDTFRQINVRLLGINTPEIRGGTTDTKILAKAAKQYVFDVLSTAGYIRIKTIKDSTDKYGRYLAEVIYSPDKISKGTLVKIRQNPFEKLLKTGSLAVFKDLSNELLNKCAGTVSYTP